MWRPTRSHGLPDPESCSAGVWGRHTATSSGAVYAGAHRRERSKSPPSWQEVGDHSFDLTISVFGAMFAPTPFDVAREMVRVTKPGGRIVMGNWIPNDPTSFVSQLLKISSSFMPPPPDGVPKEKISMVKDTYSFISPDKSPAQVIELFRRFYGPTMNAFEAAEKSGKVEEGDCSPLTVFR